ncbi:hypothetical protein [Streptomyces huasconensis]|uniref:hypothetical protein n=1 Tax=Streptomyces huasconensis TaxID=1854574 RepID=UPI003701E8D1
MRNDYDFSFELFVQLRETVGSRSSWPYGMRQARRLVEIMYNELGRADLLRFFTCVQAADANCAQRPPTRYINHGTHLGEALDDEFGASEEQALETAWLIFHTARTICGPEHTQLLTACVLAALTVDQSIPA